jgi:hypothetical protein
MNISVIENNLNDITEIIENIKIESKLKIKNSQEFEFEINQVILK